MADPYLWLKSFHIVAVTSWMAGLLYLPRLYVYHAEFKPGDGVSNQFKIMEHRLARFIMLPAGIATWVFGVIAAIWSGDLWVLPGWLIVKLLLVVILSGFHVLLEWHLREFSTDQRRHESRYFRLINEIPTVLLILIVFVVVVKPI